MRLNRLDNFSNFLRYSAQKDLGKEQNYNLVQEVHAIIICYYYRFFYAVFANFEHFRYAIQYLDKGSIDEWLMLDLNTRIRGLSKLLRILLFIRKVILIAYYRLKECWSIHYLNFQVH